MAGEHKRIANLLRELVSELANPADAARLVATPARAAEALAQFTARARCRPRVVPREPAATREPATARALMVVRDIEFFSLCEHHLLPFLGRCHIGLIPRDLTIEESELARLVDDVAHRLQLQERITQQIAEALLEALDPEGLAVATEARHFCMMMRGVQQQEERIESSAVLGVLRERADLRRTFFDLVRHSGGTRWRAPG